jgi:hypothetical protein
VLLAVTTTNHYYMLLLIVSDCQIDVFGQTILIAMFTFSQDSPAATQQNRLKFIFDQWPGVWDSVRMNMIQYFLQVTGNALARSGNTIVY